VNPAFVLAGHQDVWELPRARGLWAWLDTCPWNDPNRGLAIGCVRTVAPHRFDLEAEIERRIRAAAVGCRVLESDTAVSSVEALFATTDLHHAIGQAVEDLRQSPAGLVWVIDRDLLSDDLQDGSKIYEFFNLVSRTAGRSLDANERSLGVILIGTTEAQVVSNIHWFDLSIGQPALSHPVRIKEVWTKFVHEEVAWWFGGHLELVREFELSGVSLTQGSDDALKHLLKEQARALFRGLGAETVARLETGLADSTDLLPERCLSGIAGPWFGTPAPWFCFALLDFAHSHPNEWFLRRLSESSPFRDHALGVMLDLEMVVYDELRRRLPGELLDGRSLQELIDSAGLDANRRDLFHRVRKIRNILAHGQSLTWSGAVEIDMLAARMQVPVRRIATGRA
jgi:hypothetical protein